MNEKLKRWLDALKEFEINPNAKIICPECNKGILILKDEPIKNTNKIDRYIICDSCGKWNVATKSLS